MMRKLIVLIAVAIIICLVTLSNADVDETNLVKRKSNSPYKDYGLYSYKNRKNKKKHKHSNQKRHHEIIKKRDKDTSNEPDPPLGEVSVREDDKASLLRKRQVPQSTGHVDASKIFANATGNP
ncbi:hypothetical protein RclHR1_03210004 [Rhizophagus clarus]|uniref:Uncharacterized protein n=1 Tax=Rhizophagus clarus TaxID=94130 RepID=A0A2Z6R825_9GLOM|nr:hypothetical protein RclHR1_03210004 [Rhizophagus clarus]GES82004.1 hypothetical protein GLOIN_2v1503581 [Rhizophagus clarus]